MPKDLEAVYAFLASRSLPYIGARTADKIIDKFGAAALEVIANDPAQLTLIPGISADKADRIQQEFKRMFGMRELIAYLAQFEISPRRAMEVFRTFGPGAMQAIQQNPYLLCGEPLQLDFRHADSIAQYYQMAGDCAQRLEAALLRTLRHNAGNGHTCLPRAQLLETASNFIHHPPEKLAAALVGQLRPAAVVCGDSLCSAEGQRLGRTVQFSDSGLYPAQADHTRHLTRDTLGVPVVAAGIPTLMQAQEGADLVVTPRALDSVIAHGAALLAGSVNHALQPRLTVQQLCWLTG